MIVIVPPREITDSSAFAIADTERKRAGEEGERKFLELIESSKNESMTSQPQQ